MDAISLNPVCENSYDNDCLTEQSADKHDETSSPTNTHQFDPVVQLVDKMHISINEKNRQRSITKPKVLIRSHAIRETASPPLSNEQIEEESNGSANDPFTTTRGSDRSFSELCTKQQTEDLALSLSSSLNTEIPTKSSIRIESNEKCLPVTYTDNTGINLQDFIVETLHRNYKDRTTLLRIEQEMIELIKSERTHHKFSSMSSYHRMLVHRVAAFFGLEHNVDQTGNCVVVSKSSRTRLPSNGFKTWIQNNIILPEEPNKKMNLKREVLSLDEFHGRELHLELQRRLGQNRSQSCEGNHANSAGISINSRHQFLQNQFPIVVETTCDSIQNKHLAVSSTSTSSGARPKQYKSAPKCNRENEDLIPYNVNSNAWNFLRPNRIPKVESFDSRELFHSYDDGFRPLLVRPMKSYSFGGYVGSTCEDGLQKENIGNGYIDRNKNETYNFELDIVPNENSSTSNISRQSPISSGYKSQYSHSASSISSSSYPLSHKILLSPHYSSSSFNSSSLDEFPEPLDSYASPLVSTYESFSPVTESTEIDQSLVPEIVNLSIEDASLPTIPKVMAVTTLNAVQPGGILLNPQTGQPMPLYNYEVNQNSGGYDSRHLQSTFYESYNYSLPVALPFSNYNSDYLIPFSTGTEFTNPQTYNYVSPITTVGKRAISQKNSAMSIASLNQGYYVYQNNLLSPSSISENNSCLPVSTTIMNDSYHQPVFILERNELVDSRGLTSYVAPMFTPTEQPPCHLSYSVAHRCSTYNNALNADLRVTRTSSAMLHRQQSLPVSSAASCAQTPRLQRQKTLLSGSHHGQQHPNIHVQNQRVKPTRPPVLNVAFPKRT